jgi:hypothetical protein
MTTADWETEHVVTSWHRATVFKLFYQLEAVHLRTSLSNFSCGRGILMLVELLRTKSAMSRGPSLRRRGVVDVYNANISGW